MHSRQFWDSVHLSVCPSASRAGPLVLGPPAPPRSPRPFPVAQRLSPSLPADGPRERGPGCALPPPCRRGASPDPCRRHRPLPVPGGRTRTTPPLCCLLPPSPTLAKALFLLEGSAGTRLATKGTWRPPRRSCEQVGARQDPNREARPGSSGLQHRRQAPGAETSAFLGSVGLSLAIRLSVRLSVSLAPALLSLQVASSFLLQATCHPRPSFPTPGAQAANPWILPGPSIAHALSLQSRGLGAPRKGTQQSLSQGLEGRREVNPCPSRACRTLREPLGSDRGRGQ